MKKKLRWLFYLFIVDTLIDMYLRYVLLPQAQYHVKRKDKYVDKARKQSQKAAVKRQKGLIIIEKSQKRREEERWKLYS
jgi:hypothetical protein